MKTAKIEIPVAYEIEVTKRRGVGNRTLQVHERFEVEVPSLEACPALVTATSHIGNVLEWREHAGETWRTFEAPTSCYQERGLCTRENYDLFLDRLLQPGNGRYYGWQELSFSKTWDDRSVGFGRSVSRDEALSAPYGVIVEDGREKAEAIARRKATNLILVGGVPHRKAPLPVWVVERGWVGEPRGLQVSLSIPERLFSVFATFGHDRKDEAMAFARRASAEIGLPEPSVDERGSVEFSVPGKGVPAWKQACVAFGAMKLEVEDKVSELSSRTLIGLGFGEQALKDLRRDLGNEEALAMLEEALRNLGAENETTLKRLKIHELHKEYTQELVEDDRFALSGL